MQDKSKKTSKKLFLKLFTGKLTYEQANEACRQNPAAKAFVQFFRDVEELEKKGATDAERKELLKRHLAGVGIVAN